VEVGDRDVGEWIDRMTDIDDVLARVADGKPQSGRIFDGHRQEPASSFGRLQR